MYIYTYIFIYTHLGINFGIITIHELRRDHSREGFVSVLFAQNAKLDQARPGPKEPTTLW